MIIDKMKTGEMNGIGSQTSPILDFFKDQVVLVTGGTGFLGKVLIEKLLRSCQSIKTIYILLRSKNGQDVRQRLDELLSFQLFDRIRKDNPATTTKLVPINADIELPGLGLSSSDEALLAGSVSIVFHCAASVRFDDPLKSALEVNVVGTKRLLALCHKMSLLAAFVHVSTAYGFCNRQEIDEVVYPESVSVQKILDAAQWMDDDLISMIQPHLLSGRPSCYHYTKALAECLLADEGADLPYAIVRPSIVTASWKEPMPGWVDNYNGPTGFFVAAGKGVLRSMLVNKEVAADLVPVDVVSNLLIAVAWYTATHNFREDCPRVYNCTTGSMRRVTWREIESVTYPVMVKYPSMEMFRYPGGKFHSNKLWCRICMQVQHMIPAHLVDVLARLTGHKPGMVALYQRIHRAVHILEYFTTKEWTFYSKNMLSLMDELKGKDKTEFNFDPRTLNFEEYATDYVLGVRKYLLKEDPATLPMARRKLQRIYILGQVAQITTVLAVFRITFNNSKRVRKLWWTLVSHLLQLTQRITMHLPLLQ